MTSTPPFPAELTSAAYQFFRTVIEAIAEDRIVLPTLPDVALRVAEVSQQDDASAEDLAAEVSRDPAIAARLIRVANSAGIRGTALAATVQQAINRLGFAKTRLLVSSLATEQLYKSSSPALAKRMRLCWANSVEVAALSRTIARRLTRLEPDEAMLAGLIQEVGILPIIATAEKNRTMRDNPALLEEVIFRMQAQVGTRLLKSWNFPTPLLTVPESCMEFEREHNGPPDFADVVCVAMLHERPLRAPWLGRVDRSRVRAYARLGLDPNAGVPLTDGFNEEFNEAKSMLNG